MISSALLWQQIEDRGGSFARCLVPLLDGLGWHGDKSRLIQAVMIGDEAMSCNEVVNTMRNLGFASRTFNSTLQQIEPSILPVLSIQSKGVAVLMKKNEREMLIYDCEKSLFRVENNQHERSTVIKFIPVKADDLTKRQNMWFWVLVARFKPLLFTAAVVTLLLNLISLVLPSFISSIYKQLMSGGSKTSIGMLALGMLIFIVAGGGLKLLRLLLLHTIGSKVSFTIGREIFRRLLYFPLVATATASVSSQLARIRDFDSIRDFIVGPPLTSLLETLFSIVIIIGIALVAGPLALIPVTALVLYAGLALLLIPQARFRNRLAAEAASRKQELLIEFLSCMDNVRAVGTTAQWSRRYTSVSSEAIWASFKSAQLSAAIHSLSQLIMTLAGLATIAWGVQMVIDATINAGVLMAVMLLVWRVLMPIQSGFGVLTSIEKISGSIRQVNKFMSIEFENRIDSQAVVQRPMASTISIQQVSVRFTPEAQPALVGVNFDVNKGEFVAITGHGGCGTTTLLSVIGGLIQPQTGRILINGRNLRQIDPIQHRETLSIVPEHPHLFVGTILSNILMASPGATADELEHALTASGLKELLATLDHGLEQSVETENSIDTIIVRRIVLARMFIRPSAIVLIDKPENYGDENYVRAFLKDLKGKRTVIAATASEKIFLEADRTIYLEHGRVKTISELSTRLNSGVHDIKQQNILVK